MERVVEQVQFYKHPPTKLMRVAAYARVSSGKDAMLHSLSAQVSYYSDIIQKRRGWIYCGVYADVDTPYGQIEYVGADRHQWKESYL